MKFKNKKDYLDQRATLMNTIQGMMDTATSEEIQAKMTEVEAMDNEWEKQALEMANKSSLEDKFKALSFENKSVNVAGTIIDSTSATSNNDIYASLDYRKAFMNSVIKGISIPGEFLNSDSNTTTSDVGSVVPTTVMEKIIEKLEATGMILPLVTRTSYKGGVAIPTSTIKPVAKWVSEGGGSDKQKKTTGNITFAYYKLRCAVSVSFETDNVTLAVFEATLINNITEAMTKALEQAIISGTGTGQPKGILTETPKDDQILEIEGKADITYADLIAAEAALPLEYEQDAVWCMSKKSFMAFVGMVDSQKQPIARTNYGINGKPERTLLGRTVILNNYVSSYTKTVEQDTKFAFLFNFKDYVLNTNYQMTLKKYEDNDTDDQVTKAIMLADGKVVDKSSLVVITKKASV
ncbi:phage major capsid protein [Clostridium botulinum]|nr:phage major capsid protein [Clostridium botulinum]EKO2043671.1 phage major capsid protein [Clostridium botulinum]